MAFLNIFNTLGEIKIMRHVMYYISLILLLNSYLVLGGERCSGKKCGCYNGANSPLHPHATCWAYISKTQAFLGGWWCYTQREGVTGKQQQWAACNVDSDCVWSMNCGDCTQWKKAEQTSRTKC
jgi:hypothetical protein